MLLQIPDVLTADAGCERAADRSTAAEWVDGRVTAGHQSAQAQAQQQIPEDIPPRAKSAS